MPIKVSDDFYINIGKLTKEDIFTKVDGESVLSREFPDLDLFLCHNIAFDGIFYDSWQVCEGQTGATASALAEDTKEEAVSAMRVRIWDTGVSAFIEARDKLLKKHKLSPRYKEE